MKYLLLSILVFSCQLKQSSNNEFSSSDHEKIIALAEQEDLNALKGYFGKFEKVGYEKSVRDQLILNKALAIILTKGKDCNKETANYLWSLKSDLSFDSLQSYPIGNYSDRKKRFMGFCGHYMLLSINKKTHNGAGSIDKSLSLYMRNVYLNTLNYLKYDSKSVSTSVFAKDINVIYDQLRVAVSEGINQCRENASSDSCNSLLFFEELQAKLQSQSKKIKNKKKKHVVINLKSKLSMLLAQRKV